MRRFQLVRTVDFSGVSGTGTVAQGVEFDDGTLAIRWLGETPSTVMWESIDHAMKVHGHGGATRIQWLDPEAGRCSDCGRRMDGSDGPAPYRHPIAAGVVDLDRRDHPEDYARTCTCPDLDTDFHCPIHGGPAEVVKVSEA